MRKPIFINMIRLKTLLEQAFFGLNNAARFNLTKGAEAASSFAGKSPHMEDPIDVIDTTQIPGVKRTTSKDWVRETFDKAHALHCKADSTSYSIAKQLHKDIEGFGSGALLKTLHGIKHIEMLSCVITAYIKLYKVSLYSDIESELSTSWDSVWLAIKRLNPNVLLRAARSGNNFA